MHQQLPRASLLVAELAGGRIGADMDAFQKRLAVFYPRVTVAQIRAMRPQRLYFGAGQREAGLQRLLDKEIMPRLAVIDDQVKSVAFWFAVISRHRPASLSSPANAYKGNAERRRAARVANQPTEP